MHFKTKKYNELLKIVLKVFVVNIHKNGWSNPTNGNKQNYQNQMLF